MKFFSLVILLSIVIGLSSGFTFKETFPNSIFSDEDIDEADEMEEDIDGVYDIAPEGQSSVNTHNSRTGSMKRLYEDSTIKGEYYLKEGLKQGVAKDYWETGTVKREYSYKDDYIEGLAVDYDLKGNKIAEKMYERNKISGDVIKFYKNGQVKMQGRVKNGQRVGVSKSFYKDGALWEEVVFVAGKQDGITNIYHPNGELKIVKDYVGGVCQTMKIYEGGILKSNEDCGLLNMIKN
ncbi:MAG: antitoxin component YwqK of YwqJK toxin-antitoxin module [Lysobacterales bacterium]|jgi:antitoxin component YwqK of YwqJK toxin-antitoxin module